MDKLALVIYWIQVSRRLIYRGVLTVMLIFWMIYRLQKDAHAIYGALLSVCRSGVERRILMENIDKQHDIRSWCQLLQQYDTDSNRNVKIKRLESVINTVFHRNFMGGLVKWIQDCEDAFTELALLGQKTWNDDEIIKRCFVQNAQNIGFVDTVFEELVIDESFINS
jgi:hypothetical protein